MINQKGVTIIEAMIAAALLAIIVTSAALVAQILSRQNSAERVASERDRILANIIAMVRSQSASQLVNSSPPTISTDSILDKANLALAWSTHYFGPKAGCPDCTGRAGYVVRPIDDTNGGAYKVTIRLLDKETQYPDFTFVMVAK